MVAVSNISYDASVTVLYVSRHGCGKLIRCVLINTYSFQSENVVAVSFGAFIHRSLRFTHGGRSVVSPRVHLSLLW